MQYVRLSLLVLFGAGLLFVLHEHAQNNRYQSNTNMPVLIDTKTGAVYRISNTPGDTKTELMGDPLR